jgi:S1-C subfamily serine protease
LTCAHVVTGKTDIVAIIPGKKFEVEVVQTDVNMDLALLRIKGSPAPPGLSVLAMRTNQLTSGDKVFACGFGPNDHSPTNREGAYLRRSIGPGPSLVMTTVQVEGGFSGGPLIDEKGQLIAVSKAVESSIRFLVGVPAERAKQFLEKNGIQMESGSTSIPIKPEDIEGLVHKSVLQLYERSGSIEIKK